MHQSDSSTKTYSSTIPITSEENFYSIINEIKNKKLINQDWRDISKHPSYKDFLICPLIWRFRYHKAKLRYNKQFHRECEKTLQQQEKAYDAVHFVRHLAYTTLWPPLHTSAELAYFQKHFFPMSQKDRKRLTYLKSYDVT